jgi:hypothetical protein
MTNSQVTNHQIHAVATLSPQTHPELCTFNSHPEYLQEMVVEKKLGQGWCDGWMMQLSNNSLHTDH